jgi:hypothetical protein
MPTDEKLAKLLEQSIEASNRTTHAVRAIVRFVFIQLSFLTAAFVVWQLGLAFPDPNNCTAFGCQPNWFVSFLVAGLVITGVIVSSIAGWNELELSSVPQFQSKTIAQGVQRAVSNEAPSKPSEGARMCPNCKKVYKTALSCSDCDAWTETY